MITVYKVEGDRLVRAENLQSLNPANDIGWIDLLEPTGEEDRSVEDFLKISIPTKEDMQEIELSARLYDEDGADYMTMLCIARKDSDNPVKSPVTFILHCNTLVTVRYHESASFTQYIQKAQKKNGVTLASPGAVMIDILESVVGRIADALEDLGGQIDSISNDIFRARGEKGTVKVRTSELQASIEKIGKKGDLLSMLRESLATIARLTSHYSGTMAEGASKALRLKINTVNRDVVSLGDHANFMSGKVAFLLDATLGMISLEQNQIIKIFSIASVVFLPPTLVASVYGMNFKFMPELESAFGYPLALAAMVVSAILPILYFRRKGWL